MQMIGFWVQTVKKEQMAPTLSAMEQDRWMNNAMFKKEQAELNEYKAAYRRRMNAYLQQLNAEKAKMLKESSNTILSQGYHFSINMVYSTYHESSNFQNQF